MKTSESIAKISAAFVSAQAQMKHAQKDAKNPHFKNDYATLESVLDAVKPALAQAKLAVIQATEARENGCVLVTRIMHESGEFYEYESPLILVKQDMQGLGSATTYQRRFTVAAIFGIAQTDDDGNDAAKTDNKEKKSGRVDLAVVSNKPADTVDHAKKVNTILASFKKLGVGENAIKEKYGFNVEGNLINLNDAELSELQAIGKAIVAKTTTVAKEFPIKNYASGAP